MDHDLPPGAIDELVELIYKNRKLEACKRYVEMSGASLAQAKQFIEELTAKKRTESPDLFQKSSATGCLSTILLMVAITGSATSGIAWIIQ
jgi:hypothetical protein